MLQTIEVEIDAQGVIHPLQALPQSAERRALLTLVVPEKASASTDWRSFIGTLKDSPCFNGDPVEIQRKMRDEWSKCLLDTNVVIGLLKQQAAAIELTEAHQLDSGQIAISQITRMELLGFPGLPKEEEQRIQGFLQSCLVMLIDESIEQQAIQLRRKGNCKLPDAIIVATAQARVGRNNQRALRRM